MVRPQGFLAPLKTKFIQTRSLRLMETCPEQMNKPRTLMVNKLIYC